MKTDEPCCCGPAPAKPLSILPMAPASTNEQGCGCGGSREAPAIGPAIPGYSLCRFVKGFHEHPAGPVPRVSSKLGIRDWAGAAYARLGAGRQDYDVSPGLYCLGNPTDQSPVLATANYKLTFDSLRKELPGLDAWLLVLDTKGVNVWCAAGKKTFSTEEMVRQISQTRLAERVSHREIIAPQLGATGVSGPLVKKLSGFSITWGPIEAADIPAFLAAGKTAAPAMRKVTFPFRRRLVLIPVEVTAIGKPSLYLAAAAFVLSGIGPHIFSFSAAWTRALTLLAAFILAVLAGAVATPAFLFTLPRTAFSEKGAVAGAIAGLLAIILAWSSEPWTGLAALFLFTTAMASYLAMNFTGATPFTSPSGVEKEMRRAIPVQLAAALLSLILWVAAGFMKGA